eukprot:Hpha_TRINITY_DN70_c0_g1::TRINITY_DN70_c0_g1_i1::g.110115::m.110115
MSDHHRAPPNPMRPYRRGEEVWAFFRSYEAGSEPWFPVPNPGWGTSTPRVGKTDGWLPARVSHDFYPERFDPREPQKTGVRVHYTDRLWYSRAGERLDTSTESTRAYQTVPPDQCRPYESPPPEPLLSLLVFRWGGERACDPVHGGDGGWGWTGSVVSDPYIRGFFEKVAAPTLGTSYEVYSVFVGCSEDLTRVHAGTLCSLLRGQHRAALYFLWPVQFQETSECPAYLAADKCLTLMGDVERSGVQTRFPHHSHLYRVMLSKEWTTQLCLDPSFQVPVATKVPRALIVQNPDAAAKQVEATIQQLRRARGLPDRAVKGVAKLGYSWEAADVRRFAGVRDLAGHLDSICQQRLGLHTNSVIVQDYFDLALEIRLFYVDPRPAKGVEVQPERILYTSFRTVTDGGNFTDFERIQRPNAVQQLRGDEEALRSAEVDATKLGSRILWWLQSVCSEPPPVVRLDFMVRYRGDGKAEVALGEITELGGCFLGWDRGPEVVWGACLRSCFQDPSGVCHMPQAMLHRQPYLQAPKHPGRGKGKSGRGKGPPRGGYNLGGGH